MSDPYYFGRRPEKPKVWPGPVEGVLIQCQACKSERLRFISDQDESGELAIYLVCSCGKRWKLPVS